MWYSEALCVHVCAFRYASKSGLLCEACAWLLNARIRQSELLISVLLPSWFTEFYEGVRKWTNR